MSVESTEGSKRWSVALACGAMLLISAAISYSAARRESPTFDEPLHAAGGYLIRWAGDYRIDAEDPALFPLISTLFNSQSDLRFDANDEAMKPVPGHRYKQWQVVV